MVSKPDPHQLYSLTWSEFGSSLISSVQLFRGGNDLVDVTLAAGGRTFPAHKIVLSAASSFLRNILKSTPCTHPVVLLAGIASDDLESLLEFVYRGEVSVPPSQLQSLLQAAQCLSIQGLIPSTQADAFSPHKYDEDQPTGASTQTGNSAALARDVINSFLPIRRRKRAKRRDSASSGSKHARTDSENDNGTQNLQAASSSDSMTGGHKAEDPDNDHNPDEQADVGSPKSRGASDQPGVCPVCGATLRQARNLRRHLLTSCKHRASDGEPRAAHAHSLTDASEHIVCPVSPNLPPGALDADVVNMISHAHYLQIQNLSAAYAQPPERSDVRVSPPMATTPTID